MMNFNEMDKFFLKALRNQLLCESDYESRIKATRYLLGVVNTLGYYKLIIDQQSYKDLIYKLEKDENFFSYIRWQVCERADFGQQLHEPDEYEKYYPN